MESLFKTLGNSLNPKNNNSNTTIHKVFSVKDKLPPNETLVMATFENGDKKEVMYWNEDEGFDAQTEPHHIEVTYWRFL